MSEKLLSAPQHLTTSSIVAGGSLGPQEVTSMSIVAGDPLDLELERTPLLLRHVRLDGMQ